MTPLDQYFEALEEPNKGCMLAIKDYLLRFDNQVAISWKWNIPFFSYGKEMLAYLNIDKKSKRPYLGFWNGSLLTHPALLSEGRKMVKVLYFDVEEDLDIDLLHEVLIEVIGIIQTKRK